MLEHLQKTFSFTGEENKSDAFLRKVGNVFYLFLNRKANSFTHDFIRLIGKKLDEVEQNQGPTALITISLSKLFSGGLDLKYATNLPHQSQRWFVLEYISLLGRISLLPFPTIAVVKGAAIAGGCMFAFAHDYIYVADSAVFACNEVDIGLPLPPGMLAVIKRKHKDYKTLRDMCLFGKKFTAEQALKQGMIDGIVKGSTVIEEIGERGEKLSSYGANKQNFKKLKQELSKQVIDCCFNKQHAVGTVGQTKFPILPKL